MPLPLPGESVTEAQLDMATAALAAERLHHGRRHRRGNSSRRPHQSHWQLGVFHSLGRTPEPRAKLPVATRRLMRVMLAIGEMFTITPYPGSRRHHHNQPGGEPVPNTRRRLT